MTTPRTAHRPFTGRHMAIIMVSFFTVVVGVNLTMAMLARKSWTGLIVPNSYVASQHFNADTDKLESILARKHQLSISSDAGRVVFSALDKAGQPLNLTSVIMRLSSSQNEVQLAFVCTAGQCTAVQQLQAGVWRGDAMITLAGEEAWQQAIEIFVKAN